jgi:dihydrodipicolinate synthase/N-acetylneuraminate lyase
MLLEGLHIPLTTPFHPDGRLNTPKLAANVVRYSRTPAAGLIVLGPSSEPTLLSDDETREVLRTAAQAAAPEKVLIAGISHDSVRSTLDLADFAAAHDYDAVLVGIPSVLAHITLAREQSGARVRELLTHFRTIADRSPLPIIMYGDDGRVLPASSIIELAAHPNIIGLLTAEGSFVITEIVARTKTIQREVTVTPVFAAVTARMKKAASRDATAPLISASTLTGKSGAAIADAPALPAIRTRTKTVGFQILSRNSQSILESLEAGAVGAAPPLAACAPQGCYEVYAAWKDGDQPLAKEKQDRLSEAAYLTQHALGPGGLKFGCDLNGYFGGLPRLPHLPPTGAERTELEQQMKPLRN